MRRRQALKDIDVKTVKPTKKPNQLEGNEEQIIVQGRIQCPKCQKKFKPQGYGRHRTVCKGK